MSNISSVSSGLSYYVFGIEPVMGQSSKKNSDVETSGSQGTLDDTVYISGIDSENDLGTYSIDSASYNTDTSDDIETDQSTSEITVEMDLSEPEITFVDNDDSVFNPVSMDSGEQTEGNTNDFNPVELNSGDQTDNDTGNDFNPVDLDSENDIEDNNNDNDFDPVDMDSGNNIDDSSDDIDPVDDVPDDEIDNIDDDIPNVDDQPDNDEEPPVEEPVVDDNPEPIFEPPETIRLSNPKFSGNGIVPTSKITSYANQKLPQNTDSAVTRIERLESTKNNIPEPVTRVSRIARAYNNAFQNTQQIANTNIIT